MVTLAVHDTLEWLRIARLLTDGGRWRRLLSPQDEGWCWSAPSSGRGWNDDDPPNRKVLSRNLPQQPNNHRFSKILEEAKSMLGMLERNGRPTRIAEECLINNPSPRIFEGIQCLGLFLHALSFVEIPRAAREISDLRNVLHQDSVSAEL